ncbi:hypothetical protein NDU88_006900 [Pleurodeles waltl]|uniref:G-protein coupled receptors family 1 profile domain-containing protein n=1 Tax=Pleurodeles waltl TaxID=8319 RepID=A0AAV7LY97_PLEWA|nr:hypothetical protein NDU88_006900 [Pleurodeles waltl]
MYISGGRRASNSKRIMTHLAVEPNSAGNILILLFNISLAATIVILNLAVFLSIIFERSLRKENRFIYMMATCVSDICTGVSWFYVGVFDVLEAFPGRGDTKFIVPTFMGLSYIVILAAQVDRFHAISWPIQYSQKMTPEKTVLVVGSLWLYTIIILIICNLVPAGVALQITGYGTFVANIVTVAIMTGLNIRLYLIAKYQLEREAPTPEREAKRSSLYLVIVVASSFLLLWAPIFLRAIFCNLLSFPHPNIRNTATDPVAILTRINAVLTPVWYMRGCIPLRELLLGQLRHYCCCTFWR